MPFGDASSPWSPPCRDSLDAQNSPCVLKGSDQQRRQGESPSCPHHEVVDLAVVDPSQLDHDVVEVQGLPEMHSMS